MSVPRSVVIPFGVPEDGRGLGLGLAALVHSTAHIEGESVALAQLLRRAAETTEIAEIAESEEPSGPVEAFVSPSAWKDLSGTGTAAPGTHLVVTGAFEPPVDGQGLIQLLVFEAGDGRTRAHVEAHLDVDNAGQALVRALEHVWSQLGGDLGSMRGIGDLSWDALESVLRAERCVLHDPSRGGPHDRLAALIHLGRAVGDAPESRFPAARLASLALDLATGGQGGQGDGKLADAAMRALVQAQHDACTQPDLAEALSALSLRTGRHDDAERYAREAIELAPERARLYALVSEARRSRGDLPGALEAIEQGLLHESTDPLLNTERGMVLVQRGLTNEGEAALRMVLDERPLYAPAFTQLASLLVDRGDSVGATSLVDQALGSPNASPDVVRRAIHVSLAVEPTGIARAARVRQLASYLIERCPSDAWAQLMLARSLHALGDAEGAVRRLARVEELAPQSSLGSEAQRGRFSLLEPQAALEVEAVLRAVYSAPTADLEVLAVRSRSLAEAHAVWPSWFALGIAERRLERWTAARDAFAKAIRLSPGCTPAHMELAGAAVALADVEAALTHAKKACDLDGDTARTLAVLATALLASGRRDEAGVAIDRALAMDVTDEANRALAQRIYGDPPKTQTPNRDRNRSATGA